MASTSTTSAAAVVAPSIALLLDRVADFERRGRLSAKQARDYQRLLRRNPETAHFVAQELRRLPMTTATEEEACRSRSSSSNNEEPQQPAAGAAAL